MSASFAGAGSPSGAFDEGTDRDLRARALDLVVRGIRPGATPDESLDLVHELQVHQVELELQNEELKRAHQELVESRARYRDLYELAPVGYLTLDGNGVVTQCNFTAATMLCAEQGAIVGKSFARLLRHEDKDVYYLFWRRLLIGRTRDVCEIRLTALPEVRWLRLEGSASGDDDIEVRLTLSDVSQHRHDGRALSEAEARFRSVLAGAAEGIVLQDAAGHVLAWNAAARHFFGVAEDEVPVPPTLTLGRTVHDDGTPWRAEDLPYARAISSGLAQLNLIMGVKVHGETRWLAVNAHPLVRPGEQIPYGAVTAFSDVTSRILAERALLREHARAEAYLDVAQTMMVVLDATGHVLHANRWACDAIGRDETDVIGADWVRLAVPEDERVAVLERLEELWSAEPDDPRAGRPDPVRGAVVTRDGERLLVSWHGRQVRDEKGAVTSIVFSGEVLRTLSPEDVG